MSRQATVSVQTMISMLAVILTRCGLPSVRIGLPPYTATIPCDVPCTRGRISSGLISTIELPDINARITLSMEGAEYYPQLVLKPKHERLAARHFQGTTDLSSDIPMPYYNWPWTRFLDQPPHLPAADLWSHNYIQHPPPPFHTTLPRALFMARNCNSKNRRETIVAQLKTLGVPVDSLSTCLHSALPNAPTNLNNKSHVMEQYRVYLAFENQNRNDYVTEKLWGALASGTIPVYYGAPNIETLIPNQSAILLSTFPSLKDAAREIMRALTISSVNARYHQWRYRALPGAFVRKWNFTHVHSECRLCRFVHGMKNAV